MGIEFIKELFGVLTNAALAKLIVISSVAQMLFSMPVAWYDDTTIEVTGSLSGIETENFAALLVTGAEISIEYELSMTLYDTLSAAKKNMMASTINKIWYMPLNKLFTVNKNGRTVTISDREKAIDAVRNYTMAVEIRSGIVYQCADLYIEAHIDYPSKIELDIPRDALWNHSVPSGKFSTIPLTRKK